MDNNEQTDVLVEKQSDSDDEATIDYSRILRALWHHAWIIVVVVILGAVVMFGYTKLLVTEKYTSSATLLVKNSDSSITSSDSNVADVVSVAITSRDTIELALEIADESGVLDYEYSYKDILEALTVTVGDAGLLTFDVELASANDAYNIINAIMDALEQLSDPNGDNIFISTLQYSVIEYPRVADEKSSPNTTMNVIVGALVGAVVSVAVIVIIELVNNKIYDNDYLLTNYNFPILAEIPDFASKNREKKYAQYSYDAKA